MRLSSEKQQRSSKMMVSCFDCLAYKADIILELIENLD